MVSFLGMDDLRSLGGWPVLAEGASERVAKTVPLKYHDCGRTQANGYGQYTKLNFYNHASNIITKGAGERS